MMRPFASVISSYGPGMVDEMIYVPQVRIGNIVNRLKYIGFSTAIAATLLGFTHRVYAEEWTSLETNQTIQAGFLGMWQDSVVLRLSDGRRVVVEKAKLTAASRLQADELAEKLKQRRDERIAELAEAASAGVTIKVEPAPEYEPLPQSVSLKEYVEAASKQLEAGHFRVFWDGLPQSFQDDVKEIVRLANQSSNKNDYEANQRLMAQLGRTLLTQRDFVFNYPGLENVPPPAVEIIQKVYSPAAGIISVLGDPEVISLEALQSSNWEPMISKLDTQLAPHLAQLLRVVPVESNPLASLTTINPNSIEMLGDDLGTITITNPSGQLETLRFKLVDGKWLPDGLATSWQNDIGNVKQQVAAQAKNMQQASAASSAAIGFVGAALSNIESAETQEEFNDIIDMYVGSIMQLVASQMTAGNQGMGGPGMNAPGMGMGGYDPNMGGSSLQSSGMGGHDSGGMPGPAIPGRGGIGAGPMAGPGAGHGGPGQSGHDGSLGHSSSGDF